MDLRRLLHRASAVVPALALLALPPAVSAQSNPAARRDSAAVAGALRHFVDLRIQPQAPGVVLVTFELRNSERLGRRTVVFGRERDAWRIVHLHASNVAIPARGS